MPRLLKYSEESKGVVSAFWPGRRGGVIWRDIDVFRTGDDVLLKASFRDSAESEKKRMTKKASMMMIMMMMMLMIYQM